MQTVAHFGRHSCSFSMLSDSSPAAGRASRHMQLFPLRGAFTVNEFAEINLASFGKLLPAADFHERNMTFQREMRHVKSACRLRRFTSVHD